MGGDCGHPYDDFWSWDIKEGKWTRERMVGNTPCPRSEAACVYVRRGEPLRYMFLDSNAEFLSTVESQMEQDGGLGWVSSRSAHRCWRRRNELLVFLLRRHVYLRRSTYYHRHQHQHQHQQHTAARRSWKQVLTKGFPTYRAQSQLLVDPETGRTYLFGGFTNNDYIPSRKTVVSRSVGDVWELRVDMPGGHFEGVDVEDEGRTAQMGPWQRCFTCGSAGPWRKCGGSCRGRAFFCDPECLKEGWKDHKQSHGCRKLE